MPGGQEGEFSSPFIRCIRWDQEDHSDERENDGAEFKLHELAGSFLHFEALGPW